MNLKQIMCKIIFAKIKTIWLSQFSNKFWVFWWNKAKVINKKLNRMQTKLHQWGTDWKTNKLCLIYFWVSDMRVWSKYQLLYKNYLS